MVESCRSISHPLESAWGSADGWITDWCSPRRKMQSKLGKYCPSWIKCSSQNIKLLKVLHTQGCGWWWRILRLFRGLGGRGGGRGGTIFNFLLKWQERREGRVWEGIYRATLPWQKTNKLCIKDKCNYGDLVLQNSYNSWNSKNAWMWGTSRQTTCLGVYRCQACRIVKNTSKYMNKKTNKTQWSVHDSDINGGTSHET